MAYLDRQSVIDHLRKTNNDYNKYFPNDDELYEYAYKNINPKKWTGNPDAEFEPPEAIYEQRIEEQEKYELEQKAKTEPPGKINTKHPRTMFEFNLAGQLGDLFDSNYLRYAATQGLADLGRVITTGKSGWKLIDDESGQEISPEEYAENLNVFEEVGAWILGQGNAADLSIWFTTAGIGKFFQVPATQAVKTGVSAGGRKLALSEGAQTWFQKKWSNSVFDNFAQSQRAKGGRFNRWIAETIENYPSTAASLGAFTFASATMHSAANQRKSKIDPETGTYVGDVDPIKVITDGTYEGLKAATLLAAPTAGVAPGILGTLGKVSSKLEKSNSRFNLKLSQFIKNNQKIISTVPAIPIEGAIFGNLPYLIDGVPMNKDGNVDFDQVAHDWLHGSVTVAGLKTTFGLFNKIGEKFKTDNQNQKANRIVETEEGKLQRESTERIRAELTDVMKPVDVEKFIKKLSESEKIKTKGDKTLSSVEGEIADYMSTLLEQSRALEKRFNESEFKLEKLSRDEIHSAMEIYNGLHALKDVYKKRLTEKGGQEYLRYVASEYNATRNKDLPLWKDLPKTEKQKIIKAGSTQLKRLVKEIETHQISINENLLKPKAAFVEAADKTKAEILKRFEALDVIKKSEIQGEVGKMGKMTPKEVLELDKKIKKLEERIPVEQQIETLRKNLLVNMPESYGKKPLEWQKLIKKETTLEGLKELEKLTLKAKEGEKSVQFQEYKKDIAPYSEKDFKLELKTKTGREMKSDGKTINTIINEASLSPVKRAELKLGFDRFVKNSPVGQTPSTYKKIIEFFEYLHKNNIETRDVKDVIAFEDFARINKIRGKNKNVYQVAISTFFGGKRAKRTGFADKYIEGLATPVTTKQTVERTFVDKPVALVTSKGAKKLLNLKYNDNRSVGGSTIQSVTELMYKFGRRIEELVRNTYVKDIDVKKGVIGLWSGKNKTRDNYPLKEMEPVLFDRLVELSKNKKPGDLLFTTKQGKPITDNKLNLILNDLVTKNKIDINYQQGKEKLTGSDFRKMV